MTRCVRVCGPNVGVVFTIGFVAVHRMIIQQATLHYHSVFRNLQTGLMPKTTLCLLSISQVTLGGRIRATPLHQYLMLMKNKNIKKMTQPHQRPHHQLKTTMHHASHLSRDTPCHTSTTALSTRCVYLEMGRRS